MNHEGAFEPDIAKPIRPSCSASDELRRNAARNLNRMFKTPEGYSNGLVDQIVDDIISAAAGANEVM